MPPYHDVYVLAPNRSVAVANCFLATFAPNRDEATSGYEFPQYSKEPIATFATSEEAIRYCVERPSESQSIYFSTRGGETAWAMLFFTKDGGLILGISVEDGEEEAFERLKEHVGSDIGYITFESPPCGTAAEFSETARHANA